MISDACHGVYLMF